MDVLMLCTSDQSCNDESILATIEGELMVDDAMSGLATAESRTYDKSRTDDAEVCQCNLPVTLLDEEMLTPDDNRSEGMTAGTDNSGPLEDESSGSSNVYVLPSVLPHTTRSDVVESQEEETTANVTTAVDRRNSTGNSVDTCKDITVNDVDCVVGNESHCECDPPLPDDASVTESCNRNRQTNMQLLQDENSEMSSVGCNEMTSTISVIDTYAPVDQSDATSDVDSTLLVCIPDVESAGNANASFSAGAVLVDHTQHTDEEAVRLKLAEAVDIEAKKKSFRVRFHEDHVVSGYLDPPTPWREGWQHSAVSLHHYVIEVT